MAKETYRSRVYTDRPAYADYDAPAKFQAIQSIIARRLREHPNAICSYSGGADSDIMLDLLERTIKAYHLQPIKYVFINTGLEMKATKDHVKAVAEKYGVEIIEARPKVNIVTAVREHGVPFVSKIMSAGLEGWQRKGIPLSIAELLQDMTSEEYQAAETIVIDTGGTLVQLMKPWAKKQDARASKNGMAMFGVIKQEFDRLCY